MIAFVVIMAKAASSVCAMPLTVIIVSTQFYPWAFITKFTHLEIIHFSNFFNDFL